MSAPHHGQRTARRECPIPKPVLHEHPRARIEFSGAGTRVEGPTSSTMAAFELDRDPVGRSMITRAVKVSVGGHSQVTEIAST
jgi:hypothetical protein